MSDDPFDKIPLVADRKRATAEAFWDPRVGDRFDEMYSYWVYVVGRDGDTVTTLESGAPCSFPDGETIEAWRGSIDEFSDRFAYGSIIGFSIYLNSRGENVTGWLTVAEEKLRATV